MRKIFSLISLAAFCLLNIAALNNDEAFFSRLSMQSSEISSITSHFTQTKYLKLLDDKIVSEGTFYYQKRGRIRFDYLQPKKMSIIMSPQKLQIIASEKKTTYKLSDQKQLAELAIVMDACISGRFNELPKGYKAKYMLEKDEHVIKISQLKNSANNPYTLIELRLNLKDYSLERLILYEKSEDYTTYDFSKIIVNQSLKQSLFMI